MLGRWKRGVWGAGDGDVVLRPDLEFVITILINFDIITFVEPLDEEMTEQPSKRRKIWKNHWKPF